MLVGDIYGDRDYSSIGLSSETIASSFGKVVSQDKDLEDYSPADIAMALCRMLSYNIGHLAYLNAKRYGLSRVFFGGFFIRGHPYTMETISFAIRYWSKVGIYFGLLAYLVCACQAQQEPSCVIPMLSCKLFTFSST